MCYNHTYPLFRSCCPCDHLGVAENTKSSPDIALRMREIMAKKLSRIARLSQRIFGEIPRELEYR